jgi:hypothetical protein
MYVKPASSGTGKGGTVRDTEGVKDAVVARLGEAKFRSNLIGGESVIKQGFDCGSDFQTLPIAACFSRSDTTACHASPRASTNSC